MRLNLGAVLHVTHAYVGAMVDAGWGRVVTVVSDAGRKGERMQAIYGAAKAGAMGFTRGLAAEVGRHGVTANCVSLGTMKTGRVRRGARRRPRARAAAWRGTTRCRGSGEPSDPAPLVALLCSDAAAWITGQVYPGRRRLRLRALGQARPTRCGAGPHASVVASICAAADVTTVAGGAGVTFGAMATRRRSKSSRARRSNGKERSPERQPRRGPGRLA